MGLFDTLFGRKVEHPPLAGDDPIRPRLESSREGLESLASQVRDTLEVVPSDDRLYVFIGKPPKQFGLAWVEDGGVTNLKTFIQEKKLAPPAVQPAIEKVREAYRESESAPRFSTHVGPHAFIVTPSVDLGRRVEGILSSLA